jgi:RNA polymerase sigma-70 factor (ECF subfamily)
MRFFFPAFCEIITLMKTDEELMEAYRDGSEEAFGFLYEKYSPMVWAFIVKRIRPSEREDLFQKVWRKLHEKRTLYKDRPFAPWFFVLMRHLLIDEYRSLDRKNYKDIQEQLIDSLHSDEKTLLELSEILQKLAPDVRELVSKYYIEGITYEELEKETGLSQMNLRQRLSRAMKYLRKVYEN